MDKNTIIKIADLAKIEINDDELDEITSSLNKILKLVDEMEIISWKIFLAIIPGSRPTDRKSFF